MAIPERAAGGASAASLGPARGRGARRAERAAARIVRRRLRGARARFPLPLRGARVTSFSASTSRPRSAASSAARASPASSRSTADLLEQVDEGRAQSSVARSRSTRSPTPASGSPGKRATRCSSSAGRAPGSAVFAAASSVRARRRRHRLRSVEPVAARVRPRSRFRAVVARRAPLGGAAAACGAGLRPARTPRAARRAAPAAGGARGRRSVRAPVRAGRGGFACAPVIVSGPSTEICGRSVARSRLGADAARSTERRLLGAAARPFDCASEARSGETDHKRRRLRSRRSAGTRRSR